MAQQTTASPATPRRRHLLGILVKDFSRLFGVAPESLDTTATFIALGADSLFLLRASQLIEDRFNLRVPFRQLMEEVTTLEALAALLDAELPVDHPLPGAEKPRPDEPAPQAPSSSPPSSSSPRPATAPSLPAAGSGGSSLERLFGRQLELMQEQLRILRERRGGAVSAPAAVSSPAPPPSPPSPPPTKKDVFVAHQALTPSLGVSLTEEQQRYLDAVVDRLRDRVAESRRLTGEAMKVMADSRTSSRFRLPFKDVSFQVLVERAQGARIWDVDGNEYVDLAMGFGSLLYGHSPPFILEALRGEVERGLQLGPQARLGGEVAGLIRELTGAERSCFFNSGTEAVMTALRLARTVTGRDKILLFAGSYHGTADGVLVRGSELEGEEGKALAMAPGIPGGILHDTLAFEYGSPAALDAVREHASELAAVLVEPRQTRRPDFALGDFLHRLREVTAEHDVALIFDEVVTGFRTHPGGAQALFGVEADLVTYGKAIGGGMPIGVVAGKRRFMDAVDGGAWSFDDDSIPETEITIVRGTYFKHPLVMAAVRAALLHLKKEGPALQENLNRRTEELATTLNAIFERQGVPVRVMQFSSLFVFMFPPELRAVDMDLFFFHLMEKGVYTWENRICYLSTAHTEEDVEQVIRAVEESVEEMRRGGFFADSGGSPPRGDGRTEAAKEKRSLPLNPAQQELWFLTHLSDEASQAYNEPMAFLLRGRLDIDALRRALNRLIARHEALRTYFDPEGDVQWIAPEVTVEIPFVSLADLDHEERERRAAEILREEGSTLFDLHEPPLLRARILRLDDEEHLVAVTLHHTISDGWSNGVFIKDLRALYGQESGHPAEELGRPDQLSDHVGDHSMDAGVLAAAETFWLELYRDGTHPLELPTDRPRSSTPGYEGVRERQHLPAVLLADLKALCRAQGATLYHVLLTSFRLLIHRLSGQRELILGSLSAGQTQSGASDLMGYYLNILPLRCRLEDETRPFVDELAARRHELLLALEHQGYPISRLIEKLSLEVDPGRQPLVSAVFNLDPPLLTDFDFAGLEAEMVPTHHGCSRFDVSINAAEHRDRLALDWEYKTDLFDRTTLHRFMRQYETLLASIVAAPETAIGELAILPASERHQIFHEWNDLPGVDVAERCLHHLFEERAEAEPEVVALLTADGEEMTYRELDRRANRLALDLVKLGVGPETVVALALERSAEAVVAILGVLKAGGAYLPLDPGHPEDRLAFMIEDAGAVAVVVAAGNADVLSPGVLSGGDLPVVEVDLSGRLPRTTTAPAAGVGSHHLAYVIYTSGSTGQPKGVMIPHRGILNRVRWTLDAHPLTPEDRVLWKTPYVFDASIWELFAPLFAGARVVLERPDGHQDARQMAHSIAEHKVTVLQLVPSMLQVFLEQEEVAGCTSLRRVLCGGEALPSALHERLRDRLGDDVELINLYGPTEASIDICSTPAPPGHDRPLIPIGRPVANTRIHLLDRLFRPVPTGIPGELFADGPGVARGYLGRPGLTAERFVPNPYGAHGGRLLGTGDLARLLADGKIEFLGRIDHQVKLRGFRIELGEIETLLNRHEEIEESVAVIRDEETGGRLVAYFVAATGKRPSAEALTGYLAEKLPEYMVPAALVELEALPRTASGKLDRRALPDPEPLEASTENLSAPRTPIEEILLDLFNDLLKTDRLGIHDSFLDHGGHSLLAVRLFTQIQKILRVQLPLGTLFNSPTVAGLAEAVEEARRDEKGLSAPPLVASGVPEEEPRVLSFDQKRLWFLSQLEPDSSAYNLMSYVRFGPDLDLVALERALSEIVRRQHSLRTMFSTDDDEPMQIIRPAEPVSLAVLDLSGLPEAAELREREKVAMRETARPFELEKETLLRFHLFRLRGHEHVLLMSLHHIVSDGWSTGILVRELSLLYRAFQKGLRPSLPELPVQYADYAEWQRNWLSGEVLEAHLDHWEKKLRGAPEIIELPLDRPRPPVQSYRGAIRSGELSSDEAEAVRGLARRANVTLFMVMLGAFKALLHRYGAGDDIVLGTHIANRGRPEIEGLIGFFVNSLVLRTDLGGNPTAQELLGRILLTTLDAYAHQDLPFDRVVERLQPRRDLSVTPLYQVAFDFDHGEDSGDLQTTGLPLLKDTPTSKFDLDLTVEVCGDGTLLTVVEFSTDLFDAATIDRLLGHYRTLLLGAAAQPAERLSRLALLSDAESHQLRQGLQGPRRDTFPVETTLHALFAEQAVRAPERVAAVADGESLTYAELDVRSNRLARVLRRGGVQPGDFVGLLEERGLDFLTALLAILKAGAAYVPIEPAYPEDRRRYMLENSRMAALVTRAEILGDDGAEILAMSQVLRAVVLLGDGLGESFRDGLDGLDGVDILGSGDLAAAEDTPLPATAGPIYPAYMLYTSGSTGLPKGSIVRHDGAINHIWAEREALDLDEGLVFLQSAPSSSDISVWQFLAPVVLGGRTVIADLETVSDAPRLWKVLRDQEITLFEPVPAVLRGLLDHVGTLPENERRLPALDWMMATGEAVPVDLVNAWLERFPEIPALNAYGPTEASDDVTQRAFETPLPESVRSVSIGRPLANIDAHVLDRHGEVVPVGVPGELLIGGIAVGNGYWRDPQKTALAFVPDVFAPGEGARLYRTGDLVRWLPGGDLEFLGRIDHQVKVRGFRIELGEIEAVLRDHPDLDDAAVLTQGDTGEKTLVAFLVGAGTEVPSIGDLRAFVRERLPEHMTPAAFVELEEMPLTPAGKIDRQALARLDGRAAVPTEELVEPRTPTEESLAGIWREVLDHENIGVETDFFELGGHSLLAARVLARLRNLLDVQVPLRKLFEHTTIASLATHIDRLEKTPEKARPKSIQRRRRQVRRVKEVAEGVLESS